MHCSIQHHPAQDHYIHTTPLFSVSVNREPMPKPFAMMFLSQDTLLCAFAMVSFLAVVSDGFITPTAPESLRRRYKGKTLHDAQPIIIPKKPSSGDEPDSHQ